MKLKDTVFTQQLGDEHVLVAADAQDESFHGIIKSNEVAAAITECLNEDVTEADILKKLLETFDASEDQLRKDIKAVIDRYTELGLFA